MKRWVAVVMGVLLISLPLAAGAANNNASAQQSGKNAPAAASEQSNVSEAWIDYVTKREEKKKFRDAKEKERAKNAMTDPDKNRGRFRTSK